METSRSRRLRSSGKQVRTRSASALEIARVMRPRGLSLGWKGRISQVCLRCGFASAFAVIAVLG